MIKTHTKNDYPTVIQLITGYFQEWNGSDTWRPQGTQDWLMIYTLTGKGRFGSSQGRLTANPADIVLLRPGTLHDYGVDPDAENWDLLWTHFYPRTHWTNWLNWPEEAPGLMRLTLKETDIREKIVTRFFETHHLASGGLRHREDFAMNALEEVLLWCDTQNPRSEQSRLDDRVRRTMDYLSLHHPEEISLDNLAQDLGLSVSRLRHLFRDQVGQSPQQFVEEQRLKRAKQLLELTGRSVQAIASDVGYENAFYFSTRFKQYTGLNPRDYRKQVTGTE